MPANKIVQIIWDIFNACGNNIQDMTFYDKRAGLMAQSLPGSITQTIIHHLLSPAICSFLIVCPNLMNCTHFPKFTNIRFLRSQGLKVPVTTEIVGAILNNASLEFGS